MSTGQAIMARAAAGKFLREVRQAQGLTAAQIGEAIGYSESQVLRWEQGRTDPPAAGMMAYTRVLQVPIDVVMRLLLDANATAADGMRAAADWISGRSAEHDRQLFRLAAEIPTEEDLERLITMVQNPSPLRRLWRRLRGSPANNGGDRQ